MLKGCIFDLDGTLLNTLPTITAAGNATLAKFGIAGYGESDYRGFVGMGARILVERMLASRGVTDPVRTDEILADYVARYDADASAGTVPYPGIPELLCMLKDAGCALAVLSNKPTSSVALLIRYFFETPSLGLHFTHIMGGDGDKARLKPSPYYANEIMRAWGAAPDDIAFVGDSLPDMKTAQNAGINLRIGAAWGFAGRAALAPETAFVADTPSDAATVLRARIRL